MLYPGWIFSRRRRPGTSLPRSLIPRGHNAVTRIWADGAPRLSNDKYAALAILQQVPLHCGFLGGAIRAPRGTNPTCGYSPTDLPTETFCRIGPVTGCYTVDHRARTARSRNRETWPSTNRIRTHAYLCGNAARRSAHPVSR